MDMNAHEFPITVKMMRKSLYVDDLASSLLDSQTALPFYKEAKNIFNQGSFDLRKWLNNDEKLMNAFREVKDSFEGV